MLLRWRAGSSESAWDGQSIEVLVADTQEPHWVEGGVALTQWVTRTGLRVADSQEPHWVEGGIELAYARHPLEQPSGCLAKGLECAAPWSLCPSSPMPPTLHWNEPVDRESWNDADPRTLGRGRCHCLSVQGAAGVWAPFSSGRTRGTRQESLQSESAGISVEERDEGASASGNDTPRQSTSGAFPAWTSERS